MNNRKTSCIVLSLAALAASATSLSDDSRFYGGVGLLGSNLEPRVNNTAFSVTETTSAGARVFAGVDLSKRISFEGYYSHLGAAELSNQVITGEIDYQAAGLSGLVYLYGSRSLVDREGFLLFARAGIGLLENSSTNGIQFKRLNNEHLAAGLGVEYGFRNGFGLRAEFLNHDADAQDISFSLVKRFGGSGTSAIMPKEPESESVKESQSAETTAEITQPAEPEVEASPPPPPPPPPPPEPLDSDGDGVLDDSDLCVDTAAGAVVADNGCVSSGVLQGVNFETGSAALSDQAVGTLDLVIAELRANPGLQISVQSHTDNQGSAANNMELSRQRAVTVVRYLADVGGIELARMSAVGFGESEPLQSNKTAQGRAANRRVEIEVTAQ